MKRLDGKKPNNSNILSFRNIIVIVITFSLLFATILPIYLHSKISEDRRTVHLLVDSLSSEKVIMPIMENREQRIENNVPKKTDERSDDVSLTKSRLNPIDSAPSTDLMKKLSNTLAANADTSKGKQCPKFPQDGVITELRKEFALNMPSYDTILPTMGACLMVRIYEDDKAGWTVEEVAQWIEYMNYAGVEHVYVYDNYMPDKPSESIKGWLEETFPSSLVTYHDWSHKHPYSRPFTQKPLYQKCNDNYGRLHDWMLNMDMDEYVFSSTDRDPGFLRRQIYLLHTFLPEISEFSLTNFLFLTKPQAKRLVIERVLRRTPKKSNSLDKPIYQASKVKSGIHHNRLLKGRSCDVSPEELRLNHYWGARLQDWGEDTAEIIEKTIDDDSALYIADIINSNSWHSPRLT